MIIKEVIERKPVKVSSKENPMDKKNKIKESQLFIEEWHDTCLALPDYDDVWFIADNRLCVGRAKGCQTMEVCWCRQADCQVSKGKADYCSADSRLPLPHYRNLYRPLH